MLRLTMKPYHVSIAAESFVAYLLARDGWDVSVQYGANQPDYDLIASRGEKTVKVSVKGSQDGGWGLTQSCKKERTYAEAADEWQMKHSKGTILFLVQFKGIAMDQVTRVYVASPKEVAEHLKKCRAGNGETILREKHTYKKGCAEGTTDEIPSEWKYDGKRVEICSKISTKSHCAL